MSASKHHGGCHCGKVRYEVELDLAAGAGRCNCTICTKVSSTGMIVKPDAFKLVSGEDSLTDYHRDGHPVHHPFCKHCGVHAFGHGNIPEIGGEYVSINVNSLDGVDPAKVPVTYWDGRHDNWAAGKRSEPWPVNP